MKCLLVAAPTSGSGKTTISLGLIRALKERGLDVCAYKTGPDYIDRAFLERESGYPAGNLDLHLQGRDGLFHSLSKAPADTVLIEGAMGFFDGIANTCRNSCHHISKMAGVPSLLVYRPKGEMFTAIPKIKGMADFDQCSLKAVLFNGVSERHCRLLKTALEEHTDLTCVGHVPKLPQAILKSRHLGLIQAQEIKEWESQIQEIADAIRECVDLDALIELMQPPVIPDLPDRFSIAGTDIRVGIAMDRAFSFYYRENLELLESCCRVRYFSPLHDSGLPECDLLYFGGGYPEVFRKELSANSSMRKAVREFAEAGGYIFAECGGLMYLTEEVEGSPMVGLFQGRCRLTSSLQRFGYVDLELKEECLLGKAGMRLTAHEFHKSTASVDGPTVFQISKTGGTNRWSCGFRYKNTIAGYPHFNFLGSMEMVKHLLHSVKGMENHELH